MLCWIDTLVSDEFGKGKAFRFKLHPEPNGYEKSPISTDTYIGVLIYNSSDVSLTCVNHKVLKYCICTEPSSAKWPRV